MFEDECQCVNSMRIIITKTIFLFDFKVVLYRRQNEFNKNGRVSMVTVMK